MSKRSSSAKSPKRAKSPKSPKRKSPKSSKGTIALTFDQFESLPKTAKHKIMLYLDGPDLLNLISASQDALNIFKLKRFNEEYQALHGVKVRIPTSYLTTERWGDEGFDELYGGM